MNIIDILKEETDVEAIVLPTAHSESCVEPKSLVWQRVTIVGAKEVTLVDGEIEGQVTIVDGEGELHLVREEDLDVQL